MRRSNARSARPPTAASSSRARTRSSTQTSRPASTSSSSGPDLTTDSRSANFVFAADGVEAGGLYECALDGGEFSPCLPPKAYNGLPLGEHIFQVRVYEGENAAVSSPIATWEWTVVPSSAELNTQITYGPPDVTGGLDPEAGGEAAVAFMFVANQNGATFECAIDGEAFSECESPSLYSGLALGQHIFRVRAVILDPNEIVVAVDPTPARHYFTIVEAPETFIDVGPEGEFNGKTADFAFSSSVSGATYECALDGGPFEACENPYELTGLSDGEHLLE